MIVCTRMEGDVNLTNHACWEGIDNLEPQPFAFDLPPKNWSIS